MAQLPSYRVRLFLSVDLVGSTAFKAKSGDGLEDRQTYPAWAVQIRKFFSEFPNILQSAYDRTKISDLDKGCPKVWKTLGDEIVFCVTLSSQHHAFRCVDAFLCGLREYGNVLEKSKTELDVKGCAWIAAFPTPNVAVQAIRLSEGDLTDQIGEELEKSADNDPTRFDFLGSSIDAGFRLSKESSSSLCAVTIDLAWLLAQHCHYVAESNTLSFSYEGRRELKGVAGGRPYPVIFLEAERSAIRREIGSREHTLRGISAAKPIHVRDFAHSYMMDAEIEAAKFDEAPPESYRKFVNLWKADAEGDAKSKKTFLEEYNGQSEIGSTDKLPDEVEEAVTAAVSSAEDAGRQ